MKLGRCESCEQLQAQIERMRQEHDEQRAAWAHTAQENKIRWAFEQNERERTQERYDALLEKYHALRVVGANPNDAKGLAPASRPSLPADLAIETIVERFNGNVALRRRLQRFVNLERQKPNADEERIAHAVLHWSSEEDEEAA